MIQRHSPYFDFGKTQPKQTQNYINHIALVLDASSSMDRHASTVVKVADGFIADLAQRSREMDQETRITVYSFSYYDHINCLVYDKDVLRMPSISGLYKTYGMTALVDATLQSVEDLKLTPEKYGEHSFLIYVLTDGMENCSRRVPMNMLQATLNNTITSLPDHWTLAAFVPDQRAVHEAKKFGFPAGNISVWDAATEGGLVEAGAIMLETTHNYMQMRTQGVRGSKSLFLPSISLTQVRQQLTDMTPGSYNVMHVGSRDMRMDDFMNSTFGAYHHGKGFYQLTKTEDIQDHKQIIIMDKAQKAYSGPQVRQLLGLPATGTAHVRPGAHPGYDIFVQSKAPNRKLLKDTKVLVLR